MKIQEKYLLDQPVEEVEAALQEEGCYSCIGCPYATMKAAELVTYSSITLEILDDFMDYGNQEQKVKDFVETNDERVKLKRMELRVLTYDCPGFSDRRPNINPSGMCQSPVKPDPEISIAAGKFLDLIRLRFKPRTKK